MKRYMQVTGLTALLLMFGSAAWADKTTTIWFVADSAISGNCLASTTSNKLRVNRNEKVTWKLRNDPDNRCPHFDPKNVYLLFDTDVVGKEHKIKGKSILGVGYADAKTEKDKEKFPDGLYHYKVYYNDTLAQDPELDLKGDMQLPPTPKGRGRGTAPPVKK